MGKVRDLRVILIAAVLCIFLSLSAKGTDTASLDNLLSRWGFQGKKVMVNDGRLFSSLQGTFPNAGNTSLDSPLYDAAVPDIITTLASELGNLYHLQGEPFLLRQVDYIYNLHLATFMQFLVTITSRIMPIICRLPTHHLTTPSLSRMSSTLSL